MYLIIILFFIVFKKLNTFDNNYQTIICLYKTSLKMCGNLLVLLLGSYNIKLFVVIKYKNVTYMDRLKHEDSYNHAFSKRLQAICINQQNVFSSLSYFKTYI